jgi:hypothetical protein
MKKSISIFSLLLVALTLSTTLSHSTGYKLPFQFKGGGQNKEAVIVAGEHPEFGFLLPEMAGNLKFGIIVGSESKWFSAAKSKVTKQNQNSITYNISDPILGKGNIVVKAISMNNTNGVIIEMEGNNLPENTKLLWAYGGAYGKALEKKEEALLNPEFCPNNVFSVENTAFTLYFGQSMALRTINVVTPFSSEIRLSDAFSQNSPLEFFESGKKTTSPALAATLPLKNGQKEYFCVFKQNKSADYNYYMLPEVFIEQANSIK